MKGTKLPSTYLLTYLTPRFPRPCLVLETAKSAPQSVRFVVSGILRQCFLKGNQQLGCHDQDGTGMKCLCDTELCNGAVMTSSLGHVIVVVALVISVITGYLM